MDINRKLEEIRRQPEHIRRRWVWGAVAVSMLMVFAIWIFSLQIAFKQNARKALKNTQSLSETLDKIKESAPSLEYSPLSGKTGDFSGEGIDGASAPYAGN